MSRWPCRSSFGRRSADIHPVGRYRTAQHVEVGRGRFPATGEVLAEVQPHPGRSACSATDRPLLRLRLSTPGDSARHIAPGRAINTFRDSRQTAAGRCRRRSLWATPLGGAPVTTPHPTPTISPAGGHLARRRGSSRAGAAEATVSTRGHFVIDHLTPLHPSEMTPAERAAAVAALLAAGLLRTSTRPPSLPWTAPQIHRKSQANRVDAVPPSSVTVHAG